eukprot:TRINITY_DN36_c0_g1_i3.p1 TRINITY_DN36_c0_g1~~TRINITY_DN36_c0_g1_i3.p1  ORF type:complete len:649 (-),score=40.91 TRINITY_DN36_c0_g1_i3:425-2371(-)
MIKSPCFFGVISWLLIHAIRGLYQDEVATVKVKRMNSVLSQRGLLQYEDNVGYNEQSPSSTYEDIRMTTDGCDPYNEDCSQQDEWSSSPVYYEQQQYQSDWDYVFVNVTKENSSPTTIEESTCSNVQPPDATFDCGQYSSFGLCGDIGEEYCMEDCGRCDCFDEYIPGTTDCNTVLDNGQCEAEGIKEVYCRLSCGYCHQVVEVSAAQPSSPDQGTSDCLLSQAIDCDVDALQSFKNILSGGEQVLQSWEGEDPCKWRYIICSQVDEKHDRVTKVELDFLETDFENQLQGQLVPQFSKLRYVTLFRISGQEGISGNLYPEYSVLDQLTSFEIWRTGIVGTFPPHFSKWTNLQEFITSFNQLTGSLPEEYSVWSELEGFKIGENANLIGTIPPHYSSWINMYDFHLSVNHFSGTLPSDFSVWSKCCEEFYVFENQLTGTIPPEYSTFKWIENFAVNENIMSGSMPPTFSTWVRCCEYFYTSENKLTGTLPVQYSTMTSMDDFTVRSNFLKGNLPVQYSTMKSVTQFYVYANQITGTLPQQYSTMSRMQKFAVSDNVLSGTIPSMYSVWIRCCEYFYLHTNEITGTLPPEYSTMSLMEDFQVPVNLITGTLPKEYSTMTKLVKLTAYDNEIVGFIPEEWSTLPASADIRI